MATERQIAANRANANRSTGPRSRAGRKRAGGNATVHGLTANLVFSTALAEQVEKLAREIAGSAADAILLRYARDAATAEIDLARVRRIKVALIERASSLGTLDHSPYSDDIREFRKFLASIARGEPPAVPRRADPLATMPSGELERTAEAMRRALPELIKLARYESRAAARRDKAIRQITRRTQRPQLDSLSPRIRCPRRVQGRRKSELPADLQD